MHAIDVMLSKMLTYYLHGLPDFRGKWRLLRFVGPLVKGVPVPSRYQGVTLALDAADRTNQLSILGRYDDVVPSEINKLCEDECLVDVGANCGLFSIMASHKVGQFGIVIAFEPCLSTYAVLLGNLNLNGRHNVVPFNFAIAEKFMRTQLDVSTVGHCGRHSIATADSAKVAETVAISLDDFPGICGLMGDRPTLIKIDIEGYELQALRGLQPLLQRQQTRRLVIEIDRENLERYGSTPADIYNYVRQFGFEPVGDQRDRSHYDQVFARSDYIADSRPIS